MGTTRDVAPFAGDLLAAFGAVDVPRHGAGPHDLDQRMICD